MMQREYLAFDRRSMANITLNSSIDRSSQICLLANCREEPLEEWEPKWYTSNAGALQLHTAPRQPISHSLNVIRFNLPSTKSCYQWWDWAVIFGPKQYGGRGIIDLYTETCVQHIETLTRHIRYKTTCGEVALVSTEVYQVFLRIESPFLETSTTKYLHRDKSQWMDYVWDFCTQSSLTITLSQVWNQQKLFSRDAAIMDIVYEMEHLAISVAKRINRCRLWLKVKFVSELFDEVTNVIHPWARSGDMLPYDRAWFSIN